MDINTAAPVITRDEIVISAPIDVIWDIQTDVAGWPSWQPDVDGAEASGPREGDPVDAQVDALQSALDKSLRDWLENLKRTAEAAAQD